MLDRTLVFHHPHPRAFKNSQLSFNHFAFLLLLLSCVLKEPQWHDIQYCLIMRRGEEEKNHWKLTNGKGHIHAHSNGEIAIQRMRCEFCMQNTCSSAIIVACIQWWCCALLLFLVLFEWFNNITNDHGERGRESVRKGGWRRKNQVRPFEKKWYLDAIAAGWCEWWKKFLFVQYAQVKCC